MIPRTAKKAYFTGTRRRILQGRVKPENEKNGVSTGTEVNKTSGTPVYSGFRQTLAYERGRYHLPLGFTTVRTQSLLEFVQDRPGQQ